VLSFLAFSKECCSLQRQLVNFQVVLWTTATPDSVVTKTNGRTYRQEVLRDFGRFITFLRLTPKPGESTANDVSTYMNPTCPRILYVDGFGPPTQRNLPFLSLLSFTSLMTCWRCTTGRLLPLDSRLFFHRCSLAIRWSTCPLVGALVHLFFKGYPLQSVGALIFPQVPHFFHPFCFSQ
jgi:hypothetical protein